MATDTKRSPLVILGLDVGDPESIQRWIQEGYLATMDSVSREGCWGRTAGIEMISEQGIWFSMFNGVSRGQHGYYYLRQLKPGTYDLEAFRGEKIGLVPFWSRLHRQDKKIAVIDVPDAALLPGLDGVQVPNWAIHNIHPPSRLCTEPPGLVKDIRRMFGPRMSVDNKLLSSFHHDLRLYHRMLERIEKKGRLCRYLLSQERYDLIVVVFAESHTASHQFWQYRLESPDAGVGKHAELTHAIRDVYQAIDRELGLLLKQLPDDANVFIASGTGMDDHYPTIGLIEAFCRELGYQFSPSNAALPSLSPLALYRRTVPENLRVALSRHLPRAAQERLVARQFREGTNWQKTTAFSIPSHFNSFLRVNLRGREPQGIVEPGAEYEELLQQLEADLKKITDPRSGEPAVRKLTRAAEFGCRPPLSLPDLFVQWKPRPYFMGRLLHPRAELSQPIPGFFRDSEHSDSGFFAARGPAIKRVGPIGDVSLLDLTPTFLSVMDEPVPESMTGQPIRAMLR